MQMSGPGPGDTRNFAVAMVLTFMILIGYEFFIARPARDDAARVQRVEAARQVEAPPVAAPMTRTEALNATRARRIMIDTDAVDGSLSLDGARFDDLNLRNYRQEVPRTSPEVTLLSPTASRASQDAFMGWETQSSLGIVALADSTSAWSAPEGAVLRPDEPVTLTLTTPDGLRVERTISVDRNYMFTVRDRVVNGATSPRQVRPYGVVRRQDLREDYRQNSIVHQGMIGVFGPRQTLHETRFERARTHARDRDRGRREAQGRILEEAGQGGWLGLTDHYWLTALVPSQSENIAVFYDSRNENGGVNYRAAYQGQWRTLQPGQEAVYTQRLFAGAKRVDLLRAYERDLSIPNFDRAVDWGMFWFLTRPFFALLDFFGRFAGNFGVGILLATIVIKLLLFPAVFQSNLAMTKLRKLQPKMQEIQQRFEADKARQQQEIVKLYQTEKVNPVAGCLPILLQIPVFYSLYKVLTVTIEMRHAPFFGWVRDLSAPDPLNFFNLFGLLPFNPGDIPLIGGLLHLGPWAIAYGVTMFALTSLSPPPPDKTQAAIFRWMPVLFAFMFGSFPVGLIIYWTWSNTISLIQQYAISRWQGVETEFDKFIAKRFGNRPAAAE